MPSYELAKQQLSRHLGHAQTLGLRHVVAGSIAGLCGSLVKVPVDVVKKRVQAGIYPNVAVAIVSIASPAINPRTPPRSLPPWIPPWLPNRAMGVGNFYAGWRSSIFYDMPYNAVQFTVLENVKRVVSKIKGGGQFAQQDHVIVGALTGMITSIITEPVSVHLGPS